MARNRQLRVVVAGDLYHYADAFERAAAHQVAEARHQLAREGVSADRPTWAKLPARERERAAAEARDYLRAVERTAFQSARWARMRAELDRVQRQLGRIMSGDQFTAGFQLGRSTVMKRAYAEELRGAVSALVEIAGLSGHDVGAWPRNLAVAEVATQALTGVRQLRERYRTAAREQVRGRG